ncbi:hypothetical protein [Pseudoclavibacter sp. AY1H1]|uniref:hypothetical protein n=1 Tax=Pseudoclavibacter sp. AY1H1 TaxID=2080584 RepID=UPI000CE7B357|nr:hypothetical protein [Pseudoclavibacter sp. AY1H1]PPF32657.1 hypothetical protein C5E05_19320 [Pseudoclavibacter sp. AY1H1]
MSESVSLEAIRATYAHLARWQYRAGRNPPEEPEIGSELHLDDAVFPWHPISEVCRVSLVLAGEHLRAARDLIEADQLYPGAHFTVLRSALMGAAQAVWILAAPDREERRERGLMLIGEMYRQKRAHLGEQDVRMLTVAQRALLASQLEWCQTRVGQVKDARRSQQQFTQTHVIKAALDLRFEDPEARLDGRLLWRQMSADAHVLGWSMFERADVIKSGARGGIGTMMAGGDLGHIVEPYLLSFRLLKDGWSRFDRLCEAGS